MKVSRSPHPHAGATSRPALWGQVAGSMGRAGRARGQHLECVGVKQN